MFFFVPVLAEWVDGVALVIIRPASSAISMSWSRRAGRSISWLVVVVAMFLENFFAQGRAFGLGADKQASQLSFTAGIWSLEAIDYCILPF